MYNNCNNPANLIAPRRDAFHKFSFLHILAILIASVVSFYLEKDTLSAIFVVISMPFIFRSFMEEMDYQDSLAVFKHGSIRRAKDSAWELKFAHNECNDLR